MVLADFLTETRRRWLKAFKLFKRNNRKCARNRVSPELIRSPSYSYSYSDSGSVDARAEIDLKRFCACACACACRGRASSSVPPAPAPAPAPAPLQPHSAGAGAATEPCESSSHYSSYCSYDTSRNDSLEGSSESHSDARAATRSDSAYDSASAGSSPSHSTRRAVCYATVTYFNVNDSEDSSSIRTEFTLLDADAEAAVVDDEDESAQNLINEGIELIMQNNNWKPGLDGSIPAHFYEVLQDDEYSDMDQSDDDDGQMENEYIHIIFINSEI